MGRPPLQSDERTKRNRNAVRRWKERNPQRVAAQKRRAAKRKSVARAEEKRKLDPTAELAFRPLNGVDTAPTTRESNQTDIRPDPGPERPRGLGDDPAPGAAELVPASAHETVLPSPHPPDQTANGIVEPEEFSVEAFRKLKLLRLSLSGEKPRGIESDL